MNEKLSILFFVKRTKHNVDGLLTIFIRVTENGERIEFSTKPYTLPEGWFVGYRCMKVYNAANEVTNSNLSF